MRGYLSAIALGAALLAPAALKADKHDDRVRTERYYDPYTRDYHEWNTDQDRAYRDWLQSNHRAYRDLRKSSKKEQREYWRYWHEHHANERDRDRDRDRR
jgi:hypothetical protein